MKPKKPLPHVRPDPIWQFGEREFKKAQPPKKVGADLPATEKCAD